MKDPTLEQLQRSLSNKSTAHERLSVYLMALIKLSRDKMSTYYSKMANNEELFAAYVPENEVEDAGEATRKSKGEQTYTTICVPYAYAAVMTMHTYITSVFLSRAPVYQVNARHGETEMQTQMMEALMDYQYNAANHMLPLFIALFDPLKYGFSVVGEYWDKETIRVRSFEDVQPTFLGLPIPGRKPIKKAFVRDISGYTGTKLYNVRPQDFFPDPRVPLMRFQDGEFCARYFEVPWADLKEDERYFNVAEAYTSSPLDSRMGGRDTGSAAVSNIPNQEVLNMIGDKPASMFKGYEIVVRIDPQRFELGASGRTEKWVFEMSQSGVIVSARPFGCFHNKFPFSVFMYDPDGYNLLPSSALERVRPLNDTLSWLLNSHFYNVRASLNNKFVVDPSRVVMKDVLSRTPGGIIRLKPEAYGADVRAAFYQVQTTDITRTHLADAQVIESLFQRMLGSTDNIMGMLGSGGRKTATEVRASTSFGSNRLKTVCELASATGFSPLVARQISLTQQFYDEERVYRLCGDLASIGGVSTVAITPESIAGQFDYAAVDGNLPIDRYAQVQQWGNLLQQAQRLPQVAMQYDLGKIFAWVAALGGLKNIQQFRIKVGDPAGLQQQATAGNIVPISQAVQTVSGIPDKGRPEGMGATA